MRGHAKLLDDGLKIVIRASVSVGGPLPVRNVDCISYEELEGITSKRPWRSPWKVLIKLKASEPETFDKIEAAKGRIFKIRLLSKTEDYKRIETEMNLRIAEAKSEAYEKRISEANPE